VLKATRVDGVYDDDPHKNSDAEMYTELSYMEVLAEGLKVMDSTAITMCREHEVPIVVFNITTHGNIVKAVQGERIGTLVH
jgi:uridylate kinase